MILITILTSLLVLVNANQSNKPIASHSVQPAKPLQPAQLAQSAQPVQPAQPEHSITSNFTTLYNSTSLILIHRNTALKLSFDGWIEELNQLERVNINYISSIYAEREKADLLAVLGILTASIEDGKVYTFSHAFNSSLVKSFVLNPKSTSVSTITYLPVSYSIGTVIQLKLYFIIVEKIEIFVAGGDRVLWYLSSVLMPEGSIQSKFYYYALEKIGSFLDSDYSIFSYLGGGSSREEPEQTTEDEL